MRGAYKDPPGALGNLTESMFLVTIGLGAERGSVRRQEKILFVTQSASERHDTILP
jgi:hypothetical protein